MDFSTDRQRAAAERIGPSLQVPRQANETGRVRSIKAQVKEMTNIDLSEDVALEWLRRNGGHADLC